MSRSVAREFSQYFADLRREIDRLPRREPKGAMLERALKIPLIWPEHEFPEGLSMAEQFKKELVTWGGHTEIVKSEDDVAPAVAEIVKKAGAKRLSRWLCPELDKFDWESALSRLDVEWTTPTPQQVAACKTYEERREIQHDLAGVDLAITTADILVAHTGTALVRHGADRNGLTNLLPWTLVIVAYTSQLVPTIQDMMDRLREDLGKDGLPPNTAFITGPSRSGDIDLTVGQGAAGPGQHHVILIDDGEKEAE